MVCWEHLENGETRRDTLTWEEPDCDDRNNIQQQLDDQHDTLAALHPPISTNIERLEDTMPEATLLIATNGGVRDRAGYGWVMALPEMNVYATGHAPVHGREVTSYRAELFGLLAVITVLNEAVHKHNRAPKAIRLYCDNKLAVDIVNKIQTARRTTFTRGGVMNALVAEYDVIQRLATTCDDAPSQFQVIHIKAYQDNDTPMESLFVPARLNVMADRLATSALRERSGTTIAGMIPGTEVLVHTMKGTIT